MQIQFKEQSFQKAAIQAVVDCFKGQQSKPATSTPLAITKADELPLEQATGYTNAPINLHESEVLANIKQVQKQNNLPESPQIERPKLKDKNHGKGYHLTIEMETGTGKTYSYIRTMYELHKAYGWSKFIIIVPSVAIREGVKKSFELTKTHFLEHYGQQIQALTYNSKQPQDIKSFAETNRISALIINTQAFNSTGKDQRRIHHELDQFGSQRPIDILASTNPILIIDEPQSTDGPKTLESMQKFKPILSLRYSATHKHDYNKIYQLDALDAYNQHLVKQIQVKGIELQHSDGAQGYLYLENISLSTTKPPYAWIEHEVRSKTGQIKRKRAKAAQGYDLYQKSGQMPAYKNQVISEIDGYRNKISVNGQDIRPGEILNPSEEHAMRRIQIRECIASHLEKEQQLFEQGIKVLSLFFIDAVEKYRQYDAQTGAAEKGEYAQLFEEEYQALRAQLLEQAQQNSETLTPAYQHYLQQDSPEQVHSGYFSIDKKNHSIDPKLKRGKEDSDDADAYELIMKDKERLLSFSEPTRFIFSHSALKEGWDNPNVFQICALKHTNNASTTRRRQEVGRGMRLCIDQEGNRQDFELLGERVHQVNKLTIIAPESYQSFAKALQQELADSLSSRPHKANTQFFLNQVIQDPDGNTQRIDQKQAESIPKYLFKYEIIDEEDNITQSGKQAIKERKLKLSETLQPFQESICQLLETINTPEAIPTIDERQTTTLNLNKNYQKKEFQALWKKINLKTIYQVNFDTQTLIQEASDQLNRNLAVSAPRYTIRSGSMQTGSREELSQGNLLKETNANYNAQKTSNPKNPKTPKKSTLQSPPKTNTRYDLIGQLDTQTGLTRRTLVTILKSINAQTFANYQKNPEEFIAQATQLINEAKAKLIINNIVYHKTQERHDASAIFTNHLSVPRAAEELKKHIYDRLVTDSQVETDFTHALEASDEVIVYAKLPRSFTIATPIANYSPDWAIVFDAQKFRHIYFVTETKGTSSEFDLRESEKTKIHCASKHFEALNKAESTPEKQVKFHHIASYDDLRAQLEEKD